MITGLGKTASKAFGPGALEITWIGFGKTRGLKPRMTGTIGVPFWTNPRDDLAILGKDKIKGAKPSMVCSFFRAGNPESTGNSIISLITTEVWGTGILIPGGTLQRRSCKYSSPSFLDPIDIALWLVCVLGGYRLAAMQSLLCTTSFSI